MAANENFYKLTAVDFRTNTVSVKLQATTSFDEWWITGLYGPQEDNEELFFLNELRQISVMASEKWLVLGDFNLIPQAQDKSNANLNRRLMGAF